MEEESGKLRAERLVARQLRKSGFDTEADKASESFINRVRATYIEADEQRRLNDHAFEIASTEMAALNAQLEAKNRELENALESLLESEKIEQLNEALSLKNNELSQLANTDSLTGLLNRYSFGRRLNQLSESFSCAAQLAVAIIDLDRFKLVNDTFGHSMGDRLLVQVADSLKKIAGTDDLVARLGGDEFAFAHVVKTENEAHDFAEQLSEVLHKPLIINGQLIHGGASVGLALCAAGEMDTSQMMRDADVAMYRAKENSLKSYQVFDLQFRQEVTRRLILEREIRTAVEEKTIRLAYQPIVSAKSGKTVLLEALSRWDSPTLKSVAPPEFIPVIERLGLSIAFGKVTLTNACAQLQQWRMSYPAVDDVAISVNFSAAQLLDPEAVILVENSLAEFELQGRCLVIELTESELLQDFDRAVVTLTKLRALGVRIAIDDFGTGYSALAYLSRFPADFLKIDKAFVQSMETNLSDRRLTEVIVDLAERFGLAPIGEGVEVETQSNTLQQFGCDLLQGYLLGKPTEVDDVPAVCGWLDDINISVDRAA